MGREVTKTQWIMNIVCSCWLVAFLPNPTHWIYFEHNGDGEENSNKWRRLGHDRPRRER